MFEEFFTLPILLFRKPPTFPTSHPILLSENIKKIAYFRRPQEKWRGLWGNRGALNYIPIENWEC